MKWVISVSLAVCLCLGICGVAAFGEDAAEVTEDKTAETGKDAAEMYRQALASGYVPDEESQENIKAVLGEDYAQTDVEAEAAQ